MCCLISSWRSVVRNGNGARRPKQSTGWGSNQRHQHFDCSPCSETKLDEEMRVFEAQITRTVSDHIADLYNSSATSGSLVRQEISGEGCVSPTVDAAELVGDHLKRKRSGFPGSKDIIEVCGCILSR